MLLLGYNNYSFKAFLKVISHKPPPHALYLPKTYRSHPCRYCISLVNGYMDLVNYGCLDFNEPQWSFNICKRYQNANKTMRMFCLLDTLVPIH